MQQEQQNKFPWLALLANLLMIAALIMRLEPSMGGQRPTAVTMAAVLVALAVYIVLDFRKVPGLNLALTVVALGALLMGGLSSLVDGHYLRALVELAAVVTGALHELQERVFHK